MSNIIEISHVRLMHRDVKLHSNGVFLQEHAVVDGRNQLLAHIQDGETPRLTCEKCKRSFYVYGVGGRRVELSERLR